MSLVAAPWHAVLFFFYGLSFAVGSGVASIIPVSVMITRVFPGRTRLANAVAGSGRSAGQLVMIANMTAVLARIGWRWGFFGSALPMFWSCH